MVQKKHKRSIGPKKYYYGPKFDTRDYYRYHMKKRGMKNIVSESLFRLILKDMFLWLFDNRLLKYKRVRLPKGMGEVLIENMPTHFVKVKGEIHKCSLVNWKKTWALWAEDYDAKKRRIKVYYDVPTYDRYVYYTEYKDFRNARFYDFILSDTLSHRIFYELTLKNNPSIKV